MGYERSKGKSTKRRMECIRAGEYVNYSPKPPPELPLDCVVAVLARLSIPILQKFRRVCKSWNQLIREERSLRRRYKEKLGLISLSISRRRRSEPDSDMLEAYTLNYFSGDDPTLCKFDFREILLDGSYRITNSCDGLVGVYGIGSFYIVNPSIDKIRGLPKSSSRIGVRSQTLQAGLGFDALTGVYKVVRLFQREVYGRVVSIGCQVLSLGGSKARCSWRLIDDPPVEAHNLPSQDCLPVSVNGAVYWRLNSGFETGSVALSFDLGQEKFNVLIHPGGSSRPRPSVSWVTELGGCLCVADTIIFSCEEKYMNVWLLKNYSNSRCKWVKQYRIDLSKVRKPIHDFCMLAKPLTIDDGRIVLCCGQGRRDYYDPETRRFGKHLQIRNIYAEYVSPYDKSLVWPWSIE